MLLAFYGQYKEAINSTKPGGKEVKTLFEEGGSQEEPAAVVCIVAEILRGVRHWG